MFYQPTTNFKGPLIDAKKPAIFKNATKTKSYLIYNYIKGFDCFYQSYNSFVLV